MQHKCCINPNNKIQEELWNICQQEVNPSCLSWKNKGNILIGL